MEATENPFHPGEIEAQRRAGVGDVASWAGGFIRNRMPRQHRDFFEALPFLVAAGSDADGRIWTTIIEGSQGFIRSPDNRTLMLDTEIDGHDPLSKAFNRGTDIGVVGIELATRRRNRMSGDIRRDGDGYRIDLRQSFGNCPQYITEREWFNVARGKAQSARKSELLTDNHTEIIKSADTMFIGTGHAGKGEDPSNGHDASHRGGAPGFVQVAGRNRLLIPDYAGNNFFNSIGNLLENPRIGLLFVSFETGSLLHVSGRAQVNWDPKSINDSGAWRTIEVEVEAVVERPGALSLRWRDTMAAPRPLSLVRKVKESETISSFYFEPVNGKPLEPYQPGQHLPIELTIPGQADPVRRTYSLSHNPHTPVYRLSIKRENMGVASRFMHDELNVGDTILARSPSGDFVVPRSDCPLVLVSAGVGLTPMVSALHSAHEAQSQRKVWFVHGARHRNHHALSKEVNQLVANSPNIEKHVFYSAPEPEDWEGRDYDHRGRITPEFLLGLNAGKSAHYMLCGPASFLSAIRNGLEAGGVSLENIHFETFGPTGSS